MLDRYEYVREDEQLRGELIALIFSFLDGYLSALLTPPSSDEK